MDDSKTLEMRLTMLEECCNEYRDRVRELEERLRRTHEEMDHKLRQNDRSERAESSPINFEFNRYADSEVRVSRWNIEQRLEVIETEKKKFNSVLQTRKPHPILPYIEWGHVPMYGSYLNAELYEMYKEFMKFAQLYKLAGNIHLTEKYIRDAEKIYNEIQQNEDKMEETYKEQKNWMKALTEKNASKEQFMDYQNTPIMESWFDYPSLGKNPYVRSTPIAVRITDVPEILKREGFGGRKNKSRKRK